jgi:CheY-like chemotaxis protein
MNRDSSIGAAAVLVVEEEPIILDMISEELTRKGFLVLEAETGEAALSMIESDQRVDVLFTDTRLPGKLNGWQLAQAARENHPEIPVVYVSGFVIEGQAAAVPGSTILKKPYRLSAVVETIRILIHNRRSAQRLWSYEGLIEAPALQHRQDR